MDLPDPGIELGSPALQADSSPAKLSDSAGKESTCNLGDLGSIPGLGRSPGEGNSYPLQYSGLENSRDRVAWRAAVHEVAKSWTGLSDFHFTSVITIEIKMHQKLPHLFHM